MLQDYVATLRNAVEGICYPLIDEVAEHGDKLGEALGEDPPPSGLTHALPGQVARRWT